MVLLLAVQEEMTIKQILMDLGTIVLRKEVLVTKGHMKILADLAILTRTGIATTVPPSALVLSAHRRHFSRLLPAASPSKKISTSSILL